MSLSRVCVLAVLASVLGGSTARADEPKAPELLPKEVTAAWEKAAAGWQPASKWASTSLRRRPPDWYRRADSTRLGGTGSADPWPSCEKHR